MKPKFPSSPIFYSFSCQFIKIYNLSRPTPKRAHWINSPLFWMERDIFNDYCLYWPLCICEFWLDLTFKLCISSLLCFFLLLEIQYAWKEKKHKVFYEFKKFHYKYDVNISIWAVQRCRCSRNTYNNLIFSHAHVFAGAKRKH